MQPAFAAGRLQCLGSSAAATAAAAAAAASTGGDNNSKAAAHTPQGGALTAEAEVSLFVIVVYA